MIAFRWTDKRDAELLAIIADGFTRREAANILGDGVLDVDAIRSRLNYLRTAGKARHPQGNVHVPRPPQADAPPAPSARPQARPLIDLSRAPSSMEQRFGRNGRG